MFATTQYTNIVSAWVEYIHHSLYLHPSEWVEFNPEARNLSLKLIWVEDYTENSLRTELLMNPFDHKSKETIYRTSQSANQWQFSFITSLDMDTLYLDDTCTLLVL